MKTDAELCKVTIKTHKNGKRLLKIEVPFGGERFEKVIREIADAHGIDRSRPDCRVLTKDGKKVWQTTGPTVWVSQSTGYAPTYNAAAYIF